MKNQPKNRDMKNQKNLKMNFKSMQEKKRPSVMFDDMNNLTTMVAKDISPSLVITGQPGLGKTFNVTKTLAGLGFKENENFVHVKGRCTAAGMFITLFENSDKLIIFDDCDSVFKDGDAVNLLKGALDSYDKRVITWMTAKGLKDQDGEMLPRSFNFTGKIIFISNLPIAKVDSAIRSRSFVLDISLTPQQLMKRMRDLLNVVEPDVDLKIKKDALSALNAAFKKFEGVELNFRSLIKAIRIRQMGFGNWRQMVAEQVMGVK
jgi:replication-associated recombination protein RarA